jgi:hypothetical protein
MCLIMMSFSGMIRVVVPPLVKCFDSWNTDTSDGHGDLCFYISEENGLPVLKIRRSKMSDVFSCLCLSTIQRRHIGGVRVGTRL